MKKHIPDFEGQVNNTVLMNTFVTDIVKNSSPQKGIGFSKPVFDLMNDIKKYNYCKFRVTMYLRDPAKLNSQ